MSLHPKLHSLRHPAFLAAGVAVATAIDLAAAGELSYRTHWLGHAGNEPPVPQEARGLAVAADGTCVVSSGPGTAAPAVATYRDGRLVNHTAAIPGGAHAFTGAVAVSERHLFAAIRLGPAPTASGPAPVAGDATGPPPGRIWHGLWRFTRDGRHAPAPAGRGAEKAFLLVHESPAGSAAPAVTGVWIHEGTVFVSDAAAGRIRAFDEATLKPTQPGFPADQPSGLCVLAGNLQVIERGAVVSAFTLDGKRTGQVLDEGDDLVPGAVAPTPEGRLLVADRGASQQVHFFNMSGVPTRVRTLGEETGVYGPPAPGEAGPRRFAGLSGVGADASGELVVAMAPPTGGFVLRRFAPDRKTLRWQIAAPSLAHGADIDPLSDGLDIYSAEGRHALDLGQAPGHSWRWVALTANPFRYPHDMRLVAATDRLTPARSDPHAAGTPPAFPRSGTTTFLEIHGHKLLALRSPDGSLLSLYRLRGQTAVPALVIHPGGPAEPTPVDLPGRPQDGPWIWRDTNGDGQAERSEFAAAPAFARGRFQHTPIDPRGGLWLAIQSREQPAAHRLGQWPCQGVDDHGIPVYLPEPSVTARMAPATPGSATDSAMEALYDPARDSLYQIAPLETGSTLRRFAVTASDNWSKNRETESSPAPPRWTVALPESFQAGTTPSLAVAGTLLFVLNPETLVVLVAETDTGTRLGQITPPASLSPAPGTAPASALRAHRRRDGSYLILTQDPATPRVLVHHLDDPQRPAPGK